MLSLKQCATVSLNMLGIVVPMSDKW